MFIFHLIFYCILGAALKKIGDTLSNLFSKPETHPLKPKQPSVSRKLIKVPIDNPLKEKLVAMKQKQCFRDN